MAKTKRRRPKIGMPDSALPVEEQERLAFLGILELSARDVEDGKTLPLAVAMKRVRARIREYAKKKR